jgi:hypothetical protein
MHQITTRARESPSYKRLIDDFVYSSSIVRLCLLQLPFPGFPFGAVKAVLLSASNAAQWGFQGDGT